MDHDGRNDAHVFRDVTQVGEMQYMDTIMPITVACGSRTFRWISGIGGNAPGRPLSPGQAAPEAGTPALPDALPYGVVATRRGNTIFLQNFSGEAKTLTLAERYADLLTSETCTGTTEIPVNGMLVMQKSST